jgi:hypothetical protein
VADDEDQPSEPTGGPSVPPPPPPPPPAGGGAVPSADATAAELRGHLAQLGDTVSSLVEGEAERRAALNRLATLVERTSARIDEVAGASTALRALGPDLEAALVEAGRQLGAQATSLADVRREIAALGSQLNELLDRRPDWEAVLEPIDARISAQAEARTDDRELIERVVAQLGGLRELAGQVPDPEALAAAVRAEVAPLAEAVEAATRAADPTTLPPTAELARLAEAVERMGNRITDGLGSVRDAAMAPVADLQAIVGGRADRTDARLDELAEQVGSLATTGPGTDDADQTSPEPATAELVTRLDRLAAAVDEVGGAVGALSWQLPESGRVDEAAAAPSADADELAEAVAAQTREAVVPSIETAARDAVAAAVESSVREAVSSAVESSVRDAVAAAVESAVGQAALQGASPVTPPPPPPPPPEPVTLDLTPVHQRLDAVTGEIERAVADRTEAAMAGLLRLLDDRLTALRDEIQRAATSAPSGGGFEAGAVLGASQAAWNRLDSRLDSEFDDLGRQLHSLGVLVERALEAVEQRQPLVTGEGIRKAAASVRDTVVGASKSRRDRRGGPRGLGSGS